jgi:hypothetical protein
MKTENNDLETTAIKAFAATTKTPFKVAFMATLGVAAAQFLLLVLGLASLAALGLIAYVAVK